jgi:hypothetical protein
MLTGASPRAAASAAARESRPSISTLASSAPSMAKPAPTRNAVRKPSFSAIRPLVADELSVTALAIAARIARPSAPPTCWLVLISPDARPASSSLMPATAPIVTDTKAKPSPTAASIDGNRTSPR